jgi:hypothetical protein
MMMWTWSNLKSDCSSFLPRLWDRPGRSARRPCTPA